MNINWKEVCKFLSGAFFVTAGASWYFSMLHVAVPFPFFGFRLMSAEFLGVRGYVHFILFMTSFYIGFIRKEKHPL
jgi:hypothetical protein